MAAPRFRDFAAKQGEMIHVDPRTIEVEAGHNPRDFSQPGMPERLQELATSIAAQGVINPLWVRMDGGKLILVDGESRLKATLLAIEQGADIKTVPAIKVVAGNAAERKLYALTANTGKPLEKWEAGTAYKQLVGWGWTLQAIADRVGTSARYVGEAIELSDTPTEVRTMLAKGEVSPRLALKEIRQNGDGAVASLTAKVEEAKAQGKTVARAERKTTVGTVTEICQQIMDDCEKDVWENENLRVNNDEAFCEFASVRHGLLVKLFNALKAGNAPLPEWK